MFKNHLVVLKTVKKTRNQPNYVVIVYDRSVSESSPLFTKHLKPASNIVCSEVVHTQLDGRMNQRNLKARTIALSHRIYKMPAVTKQKFFYLQNQAVLWKKYAFFINFLIFLLYLNKNLSVIWYLIFKSICQKYTKVQNILNIVFK